MFQCDSEGDDDKVSITYLNFQCEWDLTAYDDMGFKCNIYLLCTVPLENKSKGL